MGHGSTGAAATAATASCEAALAVQPLQSLQKLVAGVLCKAPISNFAPNLTQLRDVSGWPLLHMPAVIVTHLQRSQFQRC